MNQPGASCRWTLAIVVTLLATASPGAVVAGPPCGGSLSTVPNCVGVSPNGNLAYVVTILDCSANPVASASIELRFTTVGDSLVCWCDTETGPRPRSFFATADASGVASFNIEAGGCIEFGLAAIPGSNDFAGEVFANGVKMNEFGTVSPDAVDAAGRLPTDSSPNWDPAGFCTTGLADAVQHTTPLATAVYDWCTDVNCDLAVGLADATILTPFISGAISCPGSAGAQ